MMRTQRYGVFLFTLCAMFAGIVAAHGADKPNIVFIMADDLGNADLGYRGGEIRTPNIDRLATNGVRCESFYGMPVCTPSRAALMTGRYPIRHGLQTLVIFPSHGYGLPTDERTLPQALKAAGYQTYMVGKWHLGHADQKYWPQHRGFDHFYGNLVGEVDYFTKERGGLIDWQRNGEFLKEEAYFTTLIGNEAVKLIEAQDPKKPFFLYFASLAPHAPYQAPREYIDRYASIPDEKRRTYAGMITALDDQIGRIVAALEQKGLRNNTIILFASDNGGATDALFATGARSEADRKVSGGVGLGEKPPASNGKLPRGRARSTRAASAYLRSSTGRASSSRPSSTNRSTWWTSCPRCWRSSAAREPRIIRSTARTSGPRWPRENPLPTRRSSSMSRRSGEQSARATGSSCAWPPSRARPSSTTSPMTRKRRPTSPISIPSS